jgi:hypothetical protein
MSKRFFLVLVIAVISIPFFCCKKTEKSSDEQVPELRNDNGSTVKQIPVLQTLPAINEQFPALPFSTNAHKEHLDDPLVFENLPDGGIPNGPTAVVGSDVCLFYPIDSISTEAELQSLPNGEPIPFATIIPLGDKLLNSNPDKSKPWTEDMFGFQDNWNYFYKTIWGGRQGIVFGADLYAERGIISSSNMTNRVNALLYKGGGHFDNFYPVTGYYEIRARILGELQTNGIAFQEVNTWEYSLSMDNPDDMISLYTRIRESAAPVFVTTDLAVHANHLVFDRMLQYLEENFFFLKLTTLTDEYIKVIEEKRSAIPEDVYTTALQYFQTAQALLALAPQKVQITRGYRPVIEYHDVDEAHVLEGYPQPVVEEIEKMNKAAGFGTSSVFNIREDYSQYKVRGHYTKNGILGAYFRALMWYGRINFNLGGEGTGGIEDASATLAPVALFITDITENSPELKNLWQSLFDPITEIIGASDDISFYELAPLWNRIKGAGFAQWYSEPQKRSAFISREYRELRPPSISGSSVFLAPASGGPEPENLTPPLGWRLFGQRYTLDSEIHHHVSSPRLMNRAMVRGLDILKVFGSQTADRLLRESDYRNPETPSLERTLNAMQQSLKDVKDDYWLSTYYTNILYQIKTQALFENGTGFYFTEKPGWNLKAMNAAHGTWAELRHDTLLYVKQNYAEKGGGDGELSFRTKPLPEPIHYIEPNTPFWITSAIGIQKLYSILEKYDHLDGRTAQVLAGMYSLFVKAIEISMLEADNQEVSRYNLNWIRSFASELARLVITHIESGVIEDNDSLRMALVADVFTNAETGTVLETAVGIPYRLYIPLNDRQGGKRIAVGYGFSYYEFSQPMSNRLNNDEWKAIVYSDKPNMTKYLPFWMQGKVQPAK